MRSFGSDNHSGVHPLVLQAMERANRNHAIAYGDDDYTAMATEKIREVFGNRAASFFVFNGTGANVIASRACCRPYNAILAAKTAHIAVDECGAPSFLSGAVIKEIDTSDGKLTPENIAPSLHGFGFEHHSQPKMVYIAQCTELGTVYSREEIKTLADFVHQYGMYLHVDGARLANAAVFCNCSFKEMITDCGVDILSFGGTKNGLMMAESVVTFLPELEENLKYLRKQSTQLYSKMRYVSAQFLAYFEDDLWKKNAQNANNMAQMLRKGLIETGKCELTQATDANIILVKMNPDVIAQLLKKHFFYEWNEQTHEIRFVTSWDTTMEDINELLSDIKALLS